MNPLSSRTKPVIIDDGRLPDTFTTDDVTPLNPVMIYDITTRHYQTLSAPPEVITSHSEGSMLLRLYFSGSFHQSSAPAVQLQVKNCSTDSFCLVSSASILAHGRHGHGGGCSTFEHDYRFCKMQRYVTDIVFLRLFYI